MLRKLYISIIAALSVGALGCEAHYTTQEAYEICQDLTNRNPGASPSEAFLDCVACHENCGDACQQSGDTDVIYSCPTDTEETEDGGGGGE
ncbi:MAG: hypothetical protein HOW73_14065 [Polyangiaceae bacterium]|nr:hypothetical protein [Polyangiaceae bacterium]